MKEETWGWGIGGSKLLPWGSLREASRGTGSQPHPNPHACREYHKRVRSQGQQLQQLQAELDTLHKQVSGIRTANSEVSLQTHPALEAGTQGYPGALPWGSWLPCPYPLPSPRPPRKPLAEPGLGPEP